MPSFYFEQLLQRGLSGIDQQGITAAVLKIAGIVLVFSLLWSVYEAYSNGGDVRLLGIAAVKYLVIGLVFLNYPSAFRAVNSMFNGVADGIYNLSGGLDAVQSWLNSLSLAWNSNPNWFSAIWNLVSGGAASIIAGLITLVGYVLLPFTYTLFTLFYALYGSILYVVGPLVLALIPSRGLGQLGRSFFVNMMIFQCWGLLYAILQSLMSALEITDPMQFTGSFLNAFSGSSQVIVMSIASLLLSIMIALIPFIASRIVRGDIGSTLMTVFGTAATAGAMASSLAFAAGEGIAGGRALVPEGPPPLAAGPGGGSGSGAPGSVVSQTRSSSNGGSAIGQSRPPGPLPSETGGTQTSVTTSSGTHGLSTSEASTTAAGADSSASAGVVAGTVLRDARTGHMLSWNGSRWQDAGHVGMSTGGDGGTYVSTRWTGARSGHGYAGRSLAGLAAWQAGHLIGRTMRFVGMGKES